MYVDDDDDDNHMNPDNKKIFQLKKNSNHNLSDNKNGIICKKRHTIY